MSTAISIKHGIQALLKQAGLYQRLKASVAYDFYWAMTDPHWVTDRAKEVEFYRSVLLGFRKGDMIFDIGANEGCKTDIFLRLGAKVVAMEPDDANLEILNDKFLRNRIFPRPVCIEKKAVSSQAGTTTMWIDRPGSALNTLNPKWAGILKEDATRFNQRMDFASQKTVETTTLEDLISRHGRPFYVKIDVEGHELNVLRGLKQTVPYLSFEVNLPEFREEGVECLQILAGLAPESLFNYSADTRLGLAFKRWLPLSDFLRAFEQCNGPAIEVFWQTTAPQLGAIRK
ncbi:MAG TPA: FkbM family methyltransferase [Verrucomicrobiae bacterium]|jgi:FkbM family methyltransferase